MSWRSPWLVKPLVFLLPLVTFGLASGPMFAVLAIRRRSRRLGIDAAIYGAACVGGYVLIMAFPVESMWPIVGLFLGVGQAFVAATHAAILVPAPQRVVTPMLALEPEQRRAQARQIADRDPAMARQLGIGRPDLRRAYDDGGLLDLNEVSEDILATLEGITPQVAQAIVWSRHTWGKFGSVSDLVNRGLMGLPLPAEVTERLIVLRPTDSVGGPGQTR